MKAKEFIKPGYNPELAMIAFARYKVEEALQAALKNVKFKSVLKGRDWGFTGQEIYETVVDRESILNAYPKENIQ